MAAKKQHKPTPPTPAYSKELQYLRARLSAIDATILMLRDYDRLHAKRPSPNKRVAA